MKFREIYRKDNPVISFELFPPKTDEGMANLEKRLPKLIDLGPDCLTVTYGALGSTQERTLEVASRIKNEYNMEVAHHFTCVGLSRPQMNDAFREIQRHGIENIVAIRGDPPRGETSFVPPADGFSHGDELVEHLVNFGGFGIAVGGYPEKHLEATDFEADLTHLKQKVDRGADVVITQLFFDNADFYRFVQRCRDIGITVPIVPGLMPILKVDQIQRITSMCGASIPPDLMTRLTEADGDQSQVHEVGIDHTTQQAKDLLASGVPGIHFYVLNQHFHIAEIMHRIKPMLTPSRQPVP